MEVSLETLIRSGTVVGPQGPAGNVGPQGPQGPAGAEGSTIFVTQNSAGQIESNTINFVNTSTVLIETANNDGIINVSFTSVGGVLGITRNSAASGGTSEVVVDSWDKNTYLSAKYIIQVKSTTNAQDVQTSEVLLVHNGSATFSTEYAIVEISNTIATISSDISGDLVRLKVTPLISGTEMKTLRFSIQT